MELARAAPSDERLNVDDEIMSETVFNGDQSLPDLEGEIDLLLGNFERLSPRIRHLDFELKNIGEKISIRCSYISIRDEKITFDDFISAVSKHIISFCLPRRKIKSVRDKMQLADHAEATALMEDLSKEARKLFIKAKMGSARSGEAGEIVLYILNEWILKAPQIVSKMYLKTNNNMPVHGRLYT